MKAQISDHTKQKIMQLNDQGMSKSLIAEATGVKYSTVRSVIARLTNPDHYQARLDDIKKKRRAAYSMSDLMTIEYHEADWSHAYRAVFGASKLQGLSK